MQRLPTVVAHLLVFALAGVSTLKSDEAGRVPGSALVRTVHGQASYSFEGKSHDLRTNMALEAGVTITTGPDSYVYLNVNGVASIVRVSADTTLVLDKMDCIGPQNQGDTETMLRLQAGSALGHVTKFSANSRYEITTFCGVAGMRGAADWNLSVTQLGQGLYETTFEAVQGTLDAVLPVVSVIRMKTLHGGEAWTVGRDVGDVVPVQRQLLRWQLDQTKLMIADAGRDNGGSIGSTNIVQPFDNGPVPGQAPTSGAVPPTSPPKH